VENAQNFLATSVIFKKMPKEINHPIGDYWPNLVTLLGAKSDKRVDHVSDLFSRHLKRYKHCVTGLVSKKFAQNVAQMNFVKIDQ
jgi:hypothetical protein